MYRYIHIYIYVCMYICIIIYLKSANLSLFGFSQLLQDLPFAFAAPDRALLPSEQRRSEGRATIPRSSEYLFKEVLSTMAHMACCRRFRLCRIFGELRSALIPGGMLRSPGRVPVRKAASLELPLLLSLEAGYPRCARVRNAGQAGFSLEATLALPH